MGCLSVFGFGCQVIEVFPVLKGRFKDFVGLYTPRSLRRRGPYEEDFIGIFKFTRLTVGLNIQLSTVI